MKKFLPGDVGAGVRYADETVDRENIHRLADDCCLKANEIIYQQLQRHQGKFSINFSISGVLLELFRKYRPDVIQSFQQLSSTGYVEFLAEPYYNSLSSLHAPAEFQRQVSRQVGIIRDLFGQEAAVFRNTELIHNNKIGSLVGELKLKAVLCEGVERILQGRSCNRVYVTPGNNPVTVLLRNQALSDDIAFRFGDENWSEHPLTAEKFAGWLHAHPEGTDVINLFMDYETIGIHKKAGTGIFEFLELLPSTVLQNENFIFSTASAAINRCAPGDVYDVAKTISWEDRSVANCVWIENTMQNNTLRKIYSLEKLVSHLGSRSTLDTWSRLQAADYFYAMDDTRRNDSIQVNTGEEAFRSYTNIVADFEIGLIKDAIDNRPRRLVPSRPHFTTLTN